MESNVLSSVLQLIPTLTCLFSFPRDNRNPYDGFQVLKIGTLSQSDLGYPVLQKLLENDGLLDTFSHVEGRFTNVMVCRQQADLVKRIMSDFEIPFQVKVSDVGRQVAEAKIVNDKALEESSGMNWKAYQRFSVIQAWMDDMAQQHSDLVSVETYGKSYQNRDMKVMKISTGEFGTKPAVWIDGGIHAREWVAPATATFIANKLIDLAQNEPDNPIIKNFDWYIQGVLNPDGYEFTWMLHRLWRKTMSMNRSIFCLGTDPNRNWNFNWGGKGTSGNPCEETYRGPSAESEKEISSTSQYIQSKSNHIKLYISFHSFSQLLLTPWGFDKVPLEDANDIMPIAFSAAAALESVHGTKYKVGSPPEILYPAAGGSYDWAKGVGGIKFSYTFELRPDPDSPYGFLLPPDQITPTGEETFVAVQNMTLGVYEYYQSH